MVRLGLEGGVIDRHGVIKPLQRRARLAFGGGPESQQFFKIACALARAYQPGAAARAGTQQYRRRTHRQQPAPPRENRHTRTLP